MNSLHILGITLVILIVLCIIHGYNLSIERVLALDRLERRLEMQRDFAAAVRRGHDRALQKPSTLPTVKRRALSVPHVTLKPSYPPIK